MATIADLRKAVANAGGVLKSDGIGGFDLLAHPYARRRWKATGAWCLPLPLAGITSEDERAAEIQRAIDIVNGGTEPFNDQERG
jgi:hypothetical protein